MLGYFVMEGIIDGDVCSVRIEMVVQIRKEGGQSGLNPFVRLYQLLLNVFEFFSNYIKKLFTNLIIVIL